MIPLKEKSSESAPSIDRGNLIAFEKYISCLKTYKFCSERTNKLLFYFQYSHTEGSSALHFFSPSNERTQPVQQQRDLDVSSSIEERSQNVSCQVAQREVKSPKSSRREHCCPKENAVTCDLCLEKVEYDISAMYFHLYSKHRHAYVQAILLKKRNETLPWCPVTSTENHLCYYEDTKFNIFEVHCISIITNGSLSIEKRRDAYANLLRLTETSDLFNDNKTLESFQQDASDILV